jgi:hypothetical protein
MIVSLYQIDFIDPTTGAATRLLDIGDACEAMLDFSAKQQTETYSPLEASWGGAIALGGARRPLTWTRQIEHASHTTAASFCIRHPAQMPLRKTGKLRITLSGGEVWELLSAVVFDVSTRLDLEGWFATLTTYTAEAGETLLISGLPHSPGLPTSWILSTHAELTTPHSGT